jgi:hypothetical protein
MPKRLAMAAMLLAIPGPVLAEQPGAVRSIRFSVSACMRYCPIYSVTVQADGSAVFNGEDYTAVRGERPFRISPAQFQALARHLAPFRPANGDLRYDDSTNCQGAGEPPTDFPSRGVIWTGAEGSRQMLSFYTGCNVPPLAAALARVPEMLPIGDFIGGSH